MSQQISHGWKIDRTSAAGIPANVSSAETAPVNMTVTRPSDLITIAGATRGRFQFFGAGSNGNQGTIELFLVDSNRDPAAGDGDAGVDFYTVMLLCSVVITAENRVASRDSQFGNATAQRFSDTLTVTDGLNAALDDSRFTSNTRSYTTTDLGGELVVADFGGAAFLKINYTTLTSYTSMNTLFLLID